MKTFVLTLVPVVAGLALSAPAQTTKTHAQLLESCSGMSLGTNGALNGFSPSPNDAWHQDITTASVDPISATIMSNPNDLAGWHLHPDFGSSFGIPYSVVDSRQTANVNMPINLYAGDSDITVAPIPPDAPVEGLPAACTGVNGDQHLLVLDRNKCVAYEYWDAAYCSSKGWSADSTALFDLTTTEARPYGYTSADAAGLSVFSGLIRYDEIIAGHIDHAIRFTATHTKNDANNGYFVAPATHASGSLWGTDNIIGMRLRLKANFDISGFSPTNQIILKAMKQYGMILADNGTNMFFQGTADTRWNDDDLNQLKNITSASFDVIKMGTPYDSETAPSGAAPTISSFTATPSSVVAGTPVVLKASTNGSYSYVDGAGFLRDGVVTVTPTATTTYTLTSRNAYGSTSSTVTVTVSTRAVAQTAPVIKLVALPFPAARSWFMPLVQSNSPGAWTLSILSGPARYQRGVILRLGKGAVVMQVKQAAAGKFSAGTATANLPE